MRQSKKIAAAAATHPSAAKVSPDSTKAAKDLLDNSAEKNRNLFIFTNVLLTTLMVLVLSITDFDLLILSKPLSLPLLNVGLPLVVFSLTACVLVLALHFVLLYNLAEHRRKLDAWRQACLAEKKTQAPQRYFPPCSTLLICDMACKSYRAGKIVVASFCFSRGSCTSFCPL